jgi:hypothetical protein
MFNLIEIMFVRVLLEWDIHATPLHPASFNFKNMGDNFSQYTSQKWLVGEPNLFHENDFWVFQKIMKTSTNDFMHDCLLESIPTMIRLETQPMMVTILKQLIHKLLMNLRIDSTFWALNVLV